MPTINPGPALTQTVNTQSPYSYEKFVQTLAITMTPTAAATITTTEESFGANGVTFATAATGILPGDVILGIAYTQAQTAGVGIAGFRVDPTVTDKFYITFVNPTAGSVTPYSGVYLVTVARYNASNSVVPATFSTLPTSVF
jgi:hypothetical protein